MIELYERGIVEPDSRLSHNLMRKSAENGILWIIKFLVEKGCPVQNLPIYGTYKWNLESKQLKDILSEPVNNSCGFPDDWVRERTAAKLDVMIYLEKNNFI